MSNTDTMDTPWSFRDILQKTSTKRLLVHPEEWTDYHLDLLFKKDDYSPPPPSNSTGVSSYSEMYLNKKVDYLIHAFREANPDLAIDVECHRIGLEPKINIYYQLESHHLHCTGTIFSFAKAPCVVVDSGKSSPSASSGFFVSRRDRRSFRKNEIPQNSGDGDFKAFDVALAISMAQKQRQHAPDTQDSFKVAFVRASRHYFPNRIYLKTLNIPKNLLMAFDDPRHRLTDADKITVVSSSIFSGDEFNKVLFDLLQSEIVPWVKLSELKAIERYSAPLFDPTEELLADFVVGKRKRDGYSRDTTPPSGYVFNRPLTRRPVVMRTHLKRNRSHKHKKRRRIPVVQQSTLQCNIE